MNTSALSPCAHTADGAECHRPAMPHAASEGKTIGALQNYRDISRVIAAAAEHRDAKATSPSKP